VILILIMMIRITFGVWSSEVCWRSC